MASFADELPEDRTILYGIQSMESDNVIPEGRECPHCGNKLRYLKRYMGHLGDHRCLCGYRRPQPQVMAVEASRRIQTGYRVQDEGG